MRVVQSHVDVTQWSTSSASGVPASFNSISHLNQIADVVDARAIVLLRQEAISGCIDCLAAVPELPLELIESNLTGLIDRIQTGAIAHPDNMIQRLPTAGQLANLQSEGPLSSLDSCPSVHRYGAIVTDQADSVDVLLLELRQSLTQQQSNVLTVWMDMLRHSMALEQEVQRQRSKAALLEQVIQHTAHQARQPLALIELYTDVVLSSAIDDPMRSHLLPIRDAIADLDRHIHDLTDYQTRARLSMNQHSLHEIWTESLSHVRPWLDEKRICIKNPSQPTELWCDRWQMIQVFNNLLQNAIHFSPVEGTLTCQWQRFQEEVLIELSDEGPGIADADLPKIFESFHSRREGGTGIGLSVVKKIVLDHQGQCWATSLPHGGAKFSFTIRCLDPLDSASGS